MIERGLQKYEHPRVRRTNCQFDDVGSWEKEASAGAAGFLANTVKDQ
jgi:hypothetical protein